MTEKEQQFNQWFDEYANGVKVFEEVDMKQAYLQGQAELEKENAELKKKNLDTQDAVTMQMYTNKANKEIADKQLTKAKEIIKKMIEAIHIWDCKNLEEVKAEAEQFLKDSEVEK